MTTQDYIKELNTLTSVLRKHPQYIGFNHKFYVPGWVGFIQQSIVESKMNKAAEKPIYDGNGYYACADKIIELVDGACKAKKESVENFEKNNQDEESLQILASASDALDAWIDIYPEIAFWMNRKIDDEYITNVVGIVQDNLRESISTIMDIPRDNFKSKSNSSFGREIKAMGYQILGMLCNIILFTAIFGWLGAIFG